MNKIYPVFRDKSSNICLYLKDKYHKTEWGQALQSAIMTADKKNGGQA